MKPNTIGRILEEKVDIGLCWEFTGKPQGGGYANVSINGVRGYLHRLVYSHLVGPIPEGMDLDHLCRNRICCNPDHLEPVTSLTNKRRGAIMNRKGHLHNNAVLTADQAEEIRNIEGKTIKEISTMYGVSWAVIQRVRAGVSYQNGLV